MQQRLASWSRRVVSGCLLLAASMVSLSFLAAPVRSVSGSDFHASNIINDAIFKNKSSMSVDQIQYFLNARVPDCDRWGTQAYNGTTRRAYSESKGIVFPLTCLKDYNENPVTHENNLEGRPVPGGAQSAAYILWSLGNAYNINPQALIVMLQKEQALVMDDWPWPNQYRSAMGYGCPDSAPCDAQYYGFYNQVENAAKQFNRYAANPNQFNHAPYQSNYVRYNPNAACSGTQVFIENQSTASLYNYTPYQPNSAALANLYGTGDGCSAYGNRNFWRMFNDWFGSTQIYDPFGWEVIKTANDSRYFLVVGNTKRWIPTGGIYNDWNLDAKPLRVVPQGYFDSIPTIPELGRLGFFDNRYWFIDGGKRYLLSNEALLRAWGQYDKRNTAAPAYSLISTIPEGGEAPFYASLPSQGKVALLSDGWRFTIASSQADRWRANPIALSDEGYNAIPEAAQMDYHVSINGLKFIVDNGRLLDVTNPILLRDYGKSGTTFVPIPSSVVVFMRSEQANRLVVAEGTPHWYLLLAGQKYYVANGSVAASWSTTPNPTALSSKLFNEITTGTGTLSSIIHDASADKYYLIDRGKRELTGVMRDGLQGGPAITDINPSALSDLPTGTAISSPIIRSRETGYVYTMINGVPHHIPTGEVYNAHGVPRKYSVTDISADATAATLAPYRQVNMFIKNGSVTYFLQDGYAFPIADAALPDWLGTTTPTTNASANFGTRFNVLSSSSTQQVSESGRNTLMSRGTAVDVGLFNDAFGGGTTWPGMAMFGLPHASANTYLVKSTDSNDPRVWLINQAKKQHLATVDQYKTYSRDGLKPTQVLTPAVLDTFTTQSGNPSQLVLSGGAYKLLESDGSFFGFGDGPTVMAYLDSNQVTTLSSSVFNNFSSYRGNATRLVRDPSGKIYWVENGQKRWILSASAYQQYAATPVTNISWVISNWLPNGSVIQ